MEESSSAPASRKENAEVLWFKGTGCGIWHPVERLKEEELTDKMKKQRDQKLTQMNNNRKKKQQQNRSEIVKNETNDSAYVVQYFTPGDFHVLGKGDTVRKNVGNQQILQYVTKSISCMKKYSPFVSNKPEESMARLNKRLSKYADSVLFFLPSSDVAPFMSLFEREIPGFGSEKEGEENEPIPSTSQGAASSSSTAASPSQTYCCPYCSLTVSTRSSMFMTHMTYCSERKHKVSPGPSCSQASAGSMEQHELETPATATHEEEEGLTVMGDTGESLRDFGVKETISDEKEVQTEEEEMPMREEKVKVPIYEEEEMPNEEQEEAPASKKLEAHTSLQVEQKTDGEEVSAVHLEEGMQIEEVVQIYDGIKEQEVEHIELHVVIPHAKHVIEKVEEAAEVDAEDNFKQKVINAVTAESQSVGVEAVDTKPIPDFTATPNVEEKRYFSTPGYEKQPEASNHEPSRVLVANRVVHLVPTENEDRSITVMVVSLENMSDQPNLAYEPGEIDLESSVLRMSKVEQIDVNEPMRFKNPDEAEAAFLDKPVQDAGDLVKAFLERPPSPDNGSNTDTPPTAHHYQEPGARVVPGDLQGEAEVEESEVTFYVDARTGHVFIPDWVSPEDREVILNAQVCYKM